MRPNIDDISSGESLKKWYWLKAELVTFCKKIGINYSGSKFEILDRIALSLDAEKVVLEEKKVKPSSKFDWSKETLTLDTLITDSYTNGPNTRTFFKEYCGTKFSFSIPFMTWMKQNVGKTLRDAVKAWDKINAELKDKNTKSVIPEGNQYNQYMRDFFADNPDKTIKEARHFWQLKRDLPLGKHRYERSDLDLE
jgi:Domain of unknown function (DUF6434)/SAP domain-containing new25